MPLSAGLGDVRLHPTEAVNAHLTALGYVTGLDQAVIEQAAAMAQQMRVG